MYICVCKYIVYLGGMYRYIFTSISCDLLDGLHSHMFNPPQSQSAPQTGLRPGGTAMAAVSPRRSVGHINGTEPCPVTGRRVQCPTW